MDVQDVVFILKNAIITVLKLASPMLIGALVTGFIVALFQATTQINEPTLVFVPKIIVVLLAIVIFGPWIAESLKSFTIELYRSVLKFIL
ncbi:flagellar biosynthesis protein FliQ [Clostridium sp. 'deep sea']|uniref:flagellar biosynthesis protein FliQ n=1 Tax=Clostridium sp. 'deep sea' TaxID=2779445 RepID=UPI0018964316|nr:flagellar biosynthesis protein FliQ [Clostridium sp. 'deep sea']QOR35356.1 flagellar biosynthesis protein FliQ [Clostridium sp. 'deep sea']